MQVEGSRINSCFQRVVWTLYTTFCLLSTITNMKRFEDKSGWIRITVCCAVLIMQYSLRDVLLTALPTIASNGKYTPSDNITVTTEKTESTSIISSALTTESTDSTAANVASDIFDYIYSDNPRYDTSESSNIITNNETHSLTSNRNRTYKNTSSDGLSVSEPQKTDAKNDNPKDGSPMFVLWEMLNGRRLEPLEVKQKRKTTPTFVTQNAKNLGFYSNVPDASKKDERAEDTAFGNFWRYMRRKNNLELEDGSDLNMVEDLQMSYEIYEIARNYSLSSLKEEWSIMTEGIVLSSVYWGWLIGILIADILINKLKVRTVLIISVGVGGLMGLLTHAFSIGGPWVLLPFRIIMGVAQGLIYPVVIRILQGIPESTRNNGGFVVYLGPTVGTVAGVAIGSTDSWYIVSYVMGAMAVPLVPLCLMLPDVKDQLEKKVPLKNILKTGGVWACIAVNVSNVFTMHTVLIGLPFCLAYTSLDQPAASGLSVLAFVAVIGLLFQTVMLLSPTLSGKGPLTALNRRRLPVIVGSIFLMIGFIVMATAGLDKTGILVGLAVGAVGLGLILTRIGIRINMDDLAPTTFWRLVHIINITGVITAIFPPLIVAVLAQSDEKDWVAIWLIPLALILPSAVLYVFLLTTNVLPCDTRLGEVPAGAGGIPMANGLGPSRESLGTPTTRQSFKSARSGMSFKSAMTVQTFKTAVSRNRTRTPSCRTIDEDLSVDMRSVIDEGDDVHSIQESNDDCKSVASTNTFKSDGADMHSIDLNNPETRQQSEMYSGVSGDRTSTWLNYHHQVPIENSTTSPPTKAEIRRRNAIYEIFW